MPRLIAVTGATGNQGGAVAKLLLKYREEYKVRAITRDPSSDAAKELANLGAEVVQADLTKPETLAAAVEGCWGVFGVTNFYDSVCSLCLMKRILADGKIENQGRPWKRGSPREELG